MKKITQLLVIFSTFMLLFAGAGIQVSAADVSSNLPTLPDEVEFDLTNPEAQEYTFVDENGEEVTVGLEPIQEEGIQPLANRTIPVGATTYRIHWTTGLASMEYYIRVNRSGSTANITDAWGLSVLLIGYSEKDRKFTWSSKRAEYTGTAQLLGVPYLFNVPLRLTAEISGTTLKTSARA